MIKDDLLTQITTTDEVQSVIDLHTDASTLNDINTMIFLVTQTTWDGTMIDWLL
jgi:hypothetical protein